MLVVSENLKTLLLTPIINSAHIALKQLGEFIVNTPEGKVKLEFEWLESTYAVKVDGKLKFKFYFSEAIKTNTTNLELTTNN